MTGYAEEASQNPMHCKYGLLHLFFFIAKITMLRLAKLVQYFHLCKTTLLQMTHATSFPLTTEDEASANVVSALG